jgi:hypothetical protein
MNTKIQKTKINSISELKENDVVLCIWRKGLERNSQSSNPLPEINYRKICAITEVFEINPGEWAFHHRYPSKLSSDNGDHKIVENSINFHPLKDQKTLCTASSFGCNHRIEGYEIWKLDNVISNHETFNHSSVNLKGNPSYDLMM